MVGAATVCSPTVRLKEVVVVTLPAAAVTVIVDVPAGVEPLVLMFKVVEQVGLQEGDEKEAAVPEGRPEALKETAWVAPEVNDAIIVLEPEEPAVTETLPAFEREKAKPGVTVKEAFASALGLYPFSNAAALTTALLVSVMGWEYRVDD